VSPVTGSPTTSCDVYSSSAVHPATERPSTVLSRGSCLSMGGPGRSTERRARTSRQLLPSAHISARMCEDRSPVLRSGRLPADASFCGALGPARQIPSGHSALLRVLRGVSRTRPMSVGRLECRTRWSSNQGGRALDAAHAWPRLEGTPDVTDLSAFAELVPLDHGLCVLCTLRGNGGVHTTVVNAGAVHHS
jgi:hypothetical protein